MYFHFVYFMHDADVAQKRDNSKNRQYCVIIIIIIIILIWYALDCACQIKILRLFNVVLLQKVF